MAALFAQLPDATSFLPPGSSWAVARWLTVYCLLLLVWAMTSTRMTMDARTTFGRSKLVRWSAAAIGILIFVVIPITEPRWLIPGGILVALPPLIYYTTRFYRLGGTGLLKAATGGSKQLAVLTAIGAVKAVTIVAELVWNVLLAVLRFDWKTLSRLPDSFDRARRKIQGIFLPHSAESVYLVDAAGLPLDMQQDPRLKQFPSSTIAQFLNLLEHAARIEATDVTILPDQSGRTDVRYRVDGIENSGVALSREEGSLLGNAIKAMAGLSPSISDRPQEGSFRISSGGKRTEIAVLTTPLAFGEQISLRNPLQEEAIISQGMAALGMDDAMVKALRDIAGRPEGLLLIAGRVDSGKSTTAYAIANEMSSLGRTVVTVEKSIKCRLDNVTQIDAGNRQGIGFPAAIASALRQDPDVLLVRDVIDRDTAEAALRAAVSGRFVIACLHAEDATNALQRLLVAGIDRGLLRTALAGVLVQRLVRVLCDACKTPYEPAPELVAKLGLPRGGGTQLQREKGCRECRGTGFRGRTGVFELLVATDELQAALATDISPSDLKSKVRGAIARPLRQSAIAKVYRGITSVNEIVRVMK